ncbi:glycosyltransferase family 39 protein [Actinocrinis puniceicyclus]|uniref:Glycosyltransferase family 39 protein n=1 Tax=Actinocrinis puniceicyclus TaxID=977794 RepID=A0A8J7WJ02_9ACTN|nr:glycosyltransferase family 39 protein [Actinocrinis puniceicyclus]MBS2962193.1 glycosyltransferase family 39 protein [Actinocrinis puniceicyclus]
MSVSVGRARIPDPRALRSGGSATAPTGSSRSGSAALLPAAAVLLGVVVAIVAAVATGGISIPHNDGWSYSRAAQVFARTGHVRLFNWNKMGLVGMFIPLGPLGASVTVQQCFVAALAIVGLLAGYDVLRPMLGSRRAGLGTLVIALWPSFGLLATSFHTDIPAFAAITLTLAFGRRALDLCSPCRLYAACLVGLWGATIREQALAAPAAVLAAALLRPETRRALGLTRILAVGVALMAGLGAFELWRRGVPGGGAPPFANSILTTRLVTAQAGEAWLTISLGVSPAVLLGSRPLRWSRPARVAALLALCGCVASALANPPFLGNYVDRTGAYASAYLGSRPRIFPHLAWDLLIVLACVSGALLAGLAVERVRGLRVEVSLFALLTLLGSAMEVGQGTALFDRYMLPLALPAVALALLDPIGLEAIGLEAIRPRLVRVAVSAAAGALMAGTALLITISTLVFDSAVWNAAQHIVDRGSASAGYVDAGLDWAGWHSTTGMGESPAADAEFGIYRRDAFLSNHQQCYVVAASPQRDVGWTLVETPRYRRYGLFGAAHLYVYRTAETPCHDGGGPSRRGSAGPRPIQ